MTTSEHPKAGDTRIRRILVIAGLTLTVAAGAAIYRAINWKDYTYPGTRLMVDLGRPDAVIRTASLSQLPRDLLRVPVARDVLTEDLVFYYEQNEDRLGLNGAIKRIAYEHDLGWTDRLLASAFDEPAEVALWRDGKGALRHFAIVLRRNALTKVMQEAANVALKDSQLKKAGEVSTASGKAQAYALELNPRRTLLLVAQGERMVVLSDPGLLFDKDNAMFAGAREAIAEWLESDGTLGKKFSLNDDRPSTAASKPKHTLAVGGPTLALGYGMFMPGFKGLRFDFDSAWSTSVWVDPHGLPTTGLGHAALWRAAPANPSACMVLPVDWKVTQKVLSEAPKKPALPQVSALAAFDGSALACWYSESTLYSPVFITRLADGIAVADRDAALESLANWAIGADPAEEVKPKARTAPAKGKNDIRIWRKAAASMTVKSLDSPATPTVATHGQYVVFSPDGALVQLVLDTLSRTNPSVADQMPTSNTTLTLLTPSRLAAMSEKEMLNALAEPGDANLRAVAETHLPARMKALASYPPYRLELPAPLAATPPTSGKDAASWQKLQWRTGKDNK